MKLSVCLGCSKEPSYWEALWVPTAYVFVEKKKIFFCYTLLLASLPWSLIWSGELIQKYNLNPGISLTYLFMMWYIRKNFNFITHRARKSDILRVKLLCFSYHQLKHMYWLRRRTVSLRRFFRELTNYVLLYKRNQIFVCTLIRTSGLVSLKMEKYNDEFYNFFAWKLTHTQCIIKRIASSHGPF